MNKAVNELDSIATGDGSRVERLIERNPAIQDLINTFDLSLSTGDIIPNKKVSNEYRFSFFYNGTDNTKNTIPSKAINLCELVDIIKSDKLQNLPKHERPYITPYGVFTKRNKQSLIHYNEDIICLDYDKLKSYELRYIHKHWCNQSCTLLSVISPSGNGLKVLLRAEHTFDSDGLYEGLKENAALFTIATREVDLMQFVICQPMFIPYSEEPYFNPHAEPMKEEFKEPKMAHSDEPIKVDSIKVQATKNTSRVNAYFTNRVQMLLKALQERPRGTGTHTFLYSILMRLYPYLNQQTAIQEHELTSRLEQIILERYNGEKSKVNALYRSIAKAKEHQLNLVELINQTAKVKI